MINQFFPGIDFEIDPFFLNRQNNGFTLNKTTHLFPYAQQNYDVWNSCLPEARKIYKLYNIIYTECTQCATPKLPKKVLHIGYIVAHWGHCPGKMRFF